MKYLFLLALLPFLLAAAPTTQPAQRLPGQLIVNSVDRTYLLRIPPQYDKTKPLPLVMVLHGYGDDAAFAERAYGFAELAEKQGFFVVYPDGDGPPRGWHGLDDFDSPNDDLTFLNQLLANLKRDYRIDPARIYIAGHSVGAVMTYRLASELSDSIAAVGIVAGSVGYFGAEIIRDPRHPVSVIAFHGKADPTMPYENTTHATDSIFGATDSMSFWVKADGCKITPAYKESHEGNILSDIWTAGRAGTEVELVTIVNGNHMWPGSNVGPDKPKPNMDINATEIMWDFFTRHPKQLIPTTVPHAPPPTTSSASAAPVSDTSSTLAISHAAAAYKVDPNIPYGPLPAQRLDMLYPRNAGPNAAILLPGVIMFHGGGWIRTDKSTMSSFYNRFLAHGFVVCNVEYRMAGKDNAGNYTPDAALAPAAVQDALLSAKWFWDHADYYHVDKTRFIVTGASAGGHLALMVGMATPEAHLGPTSPTDYKIAAIVNGYGPPDVPGLLARHTSWAVQWLPPDTPDHDALAQRLSPITYVRKDIPPLLTVQGSRDTTVPVEQNQRLTKALQDLGADAQLQLASGAGHGFTTPPTAWPFVEHQIFDIFLPAHHIIPPPATLMTQP